MVSAVSVAVDPAGAEQAAAGNNSCIRNFSNAKIGFIERA